jgi:hypothetical protein
MAIVTYKSNLQCGDCCGDTDTTSQTTSKPKPFVTGTKTIKPPFRVTGSGTQPLPVNTTPTPKIVLDTDRPPPLCNVWITMTPEPTTVQ